MLTIGIDPGIGGAIAAVTPGGSLQWVIDMPVRDAGIKARQANMVDGFTLARHLRLHIGDIADVYLEHQQMRERDGMKSGSRTHETAGCIRGVLEALGFQVIRVYPQSWRSSYGLVTIKDESMTDDQRDAARKEQTRALCRQLYPGTGLFDRKRDHNRAEAVLIARFGARRSHVAAAPPVVERRVSFELSAP